MRAPSDFLGPTKPSPRAVVAVGLLLLAACGPAAPNGIEPPPTIVHDFGTIPHGKAVQHDFVLNTHALGGNWVALGVSADCTCSKSLLLLRSADGKERPITGQPFAEFAARPDEVLIVRTQIDSAQKEPADLGPLDSKAVVVLQRVDAKDPYGRVQWPLLFRFRIDSPVQVKPFAVLDFGSVPQSRTPTSTTFLASDTPGQKITFGPVHCDDPRITCRLEPEGDRTRLLTTFSAKGSALEPFRVLITIDTDLPDGYQVKLAAVGSVIDDFEVLPMTTLSFRADLSKEQPRERATSQYLVLTDHKDSRPAEFTVVKFVDAAGRSALAHFETWFEPVPGDPRGRRLFVRCLGGLREREFRGELVLAKDPSHGPFLTIQVVAFSPTPP